MFWRKVIAYILYFIECTYNVSTDIAGNKTAGFCKLCEYGFWQFPLNADKIRRPQHVVVASAVANAAATDALGLIGQPSASRGRNSR